jgi:hypothetical protein
MIQSIPLTAKSVINRGWSSVATLWVAAGLLFGFGLPKTTQAASAPPLTITVTSLTLQNGQLLASGIATLVDSTGQTVAIAHFTTPVTLTATPSANASCPILSLELQPITLNLLGLVVQTSSICLDITAHQGGGLLGNLLCSVANLLNRGLTLNQILAGLTRNVAANLLSGLTQIINSALSRVASNATLQSINAAPTDGSCAVLNLALGPLDLNVLGLEVHLYNCEAPAQPITVDITAVPGGGVLGDLLCNLAGTGGLNGLLGSLQNILNQLLGILAGL